MTAVLDRAERRRRDRADRKGERPEPAQRGSAPTLAPTLARRLRRMRAARPFGQRQLGRKVEAHTRTGPERDSSGRPATWHTTQRPPWLKRADNRRRNKAARAARRANR